MYSPNCFTCDIVNNLLLSLSTNLTNGFISSNEYPAVLNCSMVLKPPSFNW